MCVTAEVNRAIQDFTKTKYQTIEQYKNTAQARLTIDHSDGFNILQHLQERNEFTIKENLINLATGEVADESFNVNTAHVRQAEGRIGKTVRHHLNNQLSMSKVNILLSKNHN